MTPSGTANNAHTRACASVPNSAWYTPPVNCSGSTPLSECVHQPLDTIALNPLEITVNSSQTSGTVATRNASVTRTVAAQFLTLRVPVTCWKAGILAGRSNVDSVAVIR